MTAELHPTCGVGPESLLVVRVKPAGGPAEGPASDASVSADEKDAVIPPEDTSDSAAEPEREADSAAAACPVAEPISAAEKSEPDSAAAAEPVSEPCSSAAQPVGEATFEAAVKSLGGANSAVAAAPVGASCPASGPPGPRG